MGFFSRKEEDTIKEKISNKIEEENEEEEKKEKPAKWVDSIKEAISLLSEFGEKAKVVSGGTDLLMQMKQKELLPDYQDRPSLQSRKSGTGECMYPDWSA
jgi:dihydrofolate reductase